MQRQMGGSAWIATIHRFFVPVQGLYWKYARVFLHTMSWPLWGIGTTVMMAQAIRSIQANNMTAFVQTIIVYGVFVVVYQLYNGYMMKKGVDFIWSVFNKLTQVYTTKFVQSDNNAVESIGTGKMLSIIDKGVDQRSDLLQSTALYLGPALVQLAFVIYLLMRITWFAPLLLVLLVSIMLYVITLLVAPSKYWRTLREDERDTYMRNFVKVIMSRFEILINNKTSSENKKISSIVHNIAKYDQRKLVYEHRSFNTPSIMQACIAILLLSYMGYAYFVLHHVAYAEVVLYLGLLSNLDSGSRGLVDLYKTFVKNFSRIEKLRDTFDTMPQVLGYEAGADFVYKEGKIILQHVDFSYGTDPVLEKFSLEIEGGKKTALVGVSGAGKSTIIKLIAGYLHVSGGFVSVDGQKLPHSDSVDHVTLQSYYKHIGYLTQEPSVFDGTIYENLTYALDCVPTKDALQTAIQLAQCDFVYSFNQGLETQIGEKGIRLSGGQRQRLAIAKIFLKNPEIILLDEPTSALDSLSEEAITTAFNNLFLGRTVVVVAHRLQTVKKADTIVVIGKGGILERGTHQQLVAQGGVYASMLELQSGF